MFYFKPDHLKRVSMLMEHEQKKLKNALEGRSNSHLMSRHDYALLIRDSFDDPEKMKKAIEESRKRKFENNDEGFTPQDIYDKYADPICSDDEEEGGFDRDKLLDGFEERLRWSRELHDRLGYDEAEAEIQKAIDKETEADRLSKAILEAQQELARRAKAKSTARAMVRLKSKSKATRTTRKPEKFRTKIRTFRALLRRRSRMRNF